MLIEPSKKNWEAALRSMLDSGNISLNDYAKCVRRLNSHTSNDCVLDTEGGVFNGIPSSASTTITPLSPPSPSLNLILKELDIEVM